MIKSDFYINLISNKSFSFELFFDYFNIDKNKKGFLSTKWKNYNKKRKNIICNVLAGNYIDIFC